MLEILTASNFDRYETFMAKALADDSVRRFLAMDGWRQQLTSAPDNDWERVVFISDRAMGRFVFRRSPVLEIGLGLFVIGDDKRVIAGRAMREILQHLVRYRNFNLLVASVMVTNKASMRVMEKILGQPWGIEPAAAWDEVDGLVGVAHFSRPLKFVMQEFLPTRPWIPLQTLLGTIRQDIDLPLGNSGLSLHMPMAEVVQNYQMFNSFSIDVPRSSAPPAEESIAVEHLEGPLDK